MAPEPEPLTRQPKTTPYFLARREASPCSFVLFLALSCSWLVIRRILGLLVVSCLLLVVSRSC